MVFEPRENKSMAWMVTMQMEDKIAAGGFGGALHIRDLKQNSRGRQGQRWQNNKTNYKTQKAHVNM